MRKRVLCHMRTTKAQINFVIRCLDSVMSLVSVSKISNLMLASVAEQASLSLTWSETPEDTFSRDEAHIFFRDDALVRKGRQAQPIDQPGNWPTIRPVWSVFAVRMKKPRILSYPLSAQRRLWLDCVDAQADLSLRWANMSFCWFCHAADQMACKGDMYARLAGS